MTFVSDTESYERWRAGRIPVVQSDLETKHKLMAESAFVLLRGTYYRFAKQFFARERSLAQAPQTVAVGDLHIENFGTWRDRDGRLAWGGRRPLLYGGRAGRTSNGLDIGPFSGAGRGA